MLGPFIDASLTTLQPFRLWPWYAPIVLVVWTRLVYYLLHALAALLYRPYELPAGSNRTLKGQVDVSVVAVVTTRDDLVHFKEVVETWARSRVAEIIVAVPAGGALHNQVATMIDQAGQGLGRIVPLNQPDCRRLLVAACNAVNTRLTVVASLHAKWSPELLDWLVSPFETGQMIGVVSAQSTVVGDKDTSRIEDMMSSMISAVADRDMMAHYHLESCLPALDETFLIRSCIVQDGQFQRAFLSGSHPGRPGADRQFIWRWLLQNEWDSIYQRPPSTTLLTVLPSSSMAFDEQLCDRRDAMRSWARALFLDQSIWAHSPLLAGRLLIDLIGPLFIPYVISIVTMLALTVPGYSFGVALTAITFTIIASSTVRMLTIWRASPRYWQFLPLFISFSLASSVIDMITFVAAIIYRNPVSASPSQVLSPPIAINRSGLDVPVSHLPAMQPEINIDVPNVHIDAELDAISDIESSDGSISFPRAVLESEAMRGVSDISRNGQEKRNAMAVKNKLGLSVNGTSLPRRNSNGLGRLWPSKSSAPAA